MVVDKPVFSLESINVAPGTKLFTWIQRYGPTAPLAMSTTLNYTGQPGSGSNMFYALVFWLQKMGYQVRKIDEWIEISPIHSQYHELTYRQKGILEDKIKVGLESAAKQISDYELLLHDLRKYKEIVDALEKNDEQRLRAIFVDQVDIHTGQGFSLVTMVERWPTIIHDFMKVGDEENPDKIAEKLQISKAEAVILSTKNKLFKSWKQMFGEEVKKRYERLESLAKAKEKMIKELREWLKPYIMKYKTMKLGTEVPEIRKEMAFSPFSITGQATYTNGIKLWAWNALRAFEREYMEYTPGVEIYPYDVIIRDAILFGKILKIKPLSSIYPFLKEPSEKTDLGVVKKGVVRKDDVRKGDEIANDIVSAWEKGKMGFKKDTVFYEFYEIEVSRAGLRVPPGTEIEDIKFSIKGYVITQNLLLLKLVELKCREMEFEKYMDELVGDVKKKEEKKKEVKDTKVKLPYFSRGPYISDIEQIGANILPKGMDSFEKIRGFLLDKMGV